MASLPVLIVAKTSATCFSINKAFCILLTGGRLA
jgi:hypothetical protein